MTKTANTTINEVALHELMATRSGSVNPANFPDESFELYSIPAFDRGTPDIAFGSEIGSTKQVIQSGDVLLSKIVPHIRRAWIVGRTQDRRLIASGEWIVFRSKRFHGPYLRHLLTSDMFNREFMNTVSGIGGSLLRARPSHVAKIKIPLPSLDEQKRIAYLLSKVEGLIAQRKQHLQQLDDLLKSVFLDMFGDPMGNEKALPITELGKFITHLTSGGRSWAKYYAPAGKRFIRSLDVQMNSIGSDDIVYVNPPENKETERTKVQTGDVLLTITGSKVGRVCFVPEDLEEAYVSQHVAIVRTENINPIYLSYYLSMPSCGQRTIKQKQYGQAKPGINLEQIRMFPILEPKPAQQKRFAIIVKMVDRLKREYEHSIQSLQNLYSVLTQKAFNGELDLSQVLLPETIPESNYLHPPLEPIDCDYVVVHNANDQSAAYHLRESIERAEGSPDDLTLEVPTSDGLASLLNPEFQKANVESRLEAYAQQLGKQPFADEPFIGLVQHKLWVQEPPDDAQEFGIDHLFRVVDYDHVKDWIFQNLESQRLRQEYDDAHNRVQIFAAKD